ncbi:MAG: choice-of-anchor R domain-containing protein [Phycisphaerales bacterium]
MTKLMIASSVVALGLGCGVAGADVLLSNLSSSGTLGWITLGNLGAPSAIGVSFTMTQNATLDYATLRLNVGSTATPIVSIWSDSGGLPGTMLYTLTNPVFSTGYNNWSFTAPAGSTLSSGSTYHLVLQRVAGGTIAWNAGTANATGAGATFNTGVKLSGGAWVAQANTPVFELVATPTPGAAALLALGGLASARRRR